MKKLLLLAFIIPSLCFSQANDPETILRNKEAEKAEREQREKKGDSLITKCGYKIYVGQKIQLGTGTMPDGTFKYIRINSASLFRVTPSANNPNSNAAVSANALSNSFAHLQAEVSKIQKRGNETVGYANYVIIKVGGAVRYEVDIESAINSEEVEVPKDFQVKKTSEQKSQLSLADELTKLKKLLDDGILTREEFDAQKKKLLEKN